MKVIVHSAVVIVIMATVALADCAASAGTKHASANHRIASYARHFPGRYHYHYGGNSPRTGFDCSGLVQYVYRHFHKRIPRTSQQQFRRFHRETRRHARPGDLVFFHVSAQKTSWVYHVGIYEGHGRMVAAATPGDGIRYQLIWSRDVTYGTITH